MGVWTTKVEAWKAQLQVEVDQNLALRLKGGHGNDFVVSGSLEVIMELKTSLSAVSDYKVVTVTTSAYIVWRSEFSFDYEVVTKKNFN